ncbi:MAG TPA: class I SAM-dependent methyltransferase [Longimicrobiales bacterium]|nr:class I SAM-dependent methyltransferase [Longimicrobiales bacterium]
MSHSVSRHLRVDVEEYDASIRRFIPGYETMLGEAAAAVAAVGPALVLDLGAGTGALSDALLAHPEVGVVELLDVDEEMLARAQERLAGRGARARFAVRSFHDPLPECDAVAASLALHHVRTLEEKAALFGRVYAALRPGAVFVNADVTMPAEEPARAEAWRGWAAHLVASGIEEARAWEHFAEWADEDTYLPLEAELAALEGAGFAARCAWRDRVSTVVVARKVGEERR